MRKLMLLVGATSDIGHATALAYAQGGWDVILAARDAAAASRNAADLTARTGRPVPVLTLDITETTAFTAFVDGLPRLPDTVVSVVGLLGTQARAQSDLDDAALVMRSNFEGPSLLLGLFAERFAARGSGTLVGVSSVAGERGRASNYVYGAAKAGFTAFLSGLRNRLAASGIHVLTVKPGFVRTRMTAGMPLPKLLTAEPAEVGAAIFRGAEVSRRDVIYVRPVWVLVMAIIRAIPERVFKRLKL
ncbi:SDR family oxidoreductase [Methylobacterium sp. J-090]|nr:SDR family oxidoreductase [Methylobacterium sp. J-090]MCJ2081741.1 SDR family oxidoreductase [Methylobacterium sp. J-090]